MWEIKTFMQTLHSTASATPSGQFAWLDLQFPQKTNGHSDFSAGALPKQIPKGYTNGKLFYKSTHP